MVRALERRIERLEQSFGDDECPRCSNTVVVIHIGGEIGVTKNGHRLTPEAARRFYEEEQSGSVCPRCDKQRHKVRVTWSPEAELNRSRRRWEPF